ncbi:MAG: serine hydrolase [Chloroflexota bacterium]
MKYLRFGLALFALFCSMIVVHAQTSPVTAEAIGQANVRAAPDVNADLLGQIMSGAQYPVIGRNDLYPWSLIADPNTQQPIGWVFNDLVKFQGDIASVPISSQTIGGASILPTATLAPLSVDATLPASTDATVATASPVPATSAVIGTVLGEINVRYGPGTEYDRLGVAEAGATFPITARHTGLPWVQISYPQSPNGYGWVAVDLLDIQGDLDTVQQISQTNFYLPTLTPTPSMVDSAAIGQISPEFAALGATLWDNMIEAGFDPQTTRFGALYLQNLQTGEALAFEPNVAFSGMSINKIAILATLFAKINDTPDDATASIIAEVMICSENISTNKLLAIIGDGDPYTGAERVTDFLLKLGLRNTFIYTPYANDPFITPETPRTPPRTQADQVSAEPDPYNQLTVSDMGTLLHDMYQCALTEDGPLIENFDGQYTPMECRKMLDVMSYNHIFNFIEAGVPADVKVAHKHGWISDSDGDAGIVFSPGGDYIFVMALHEPTWLVWEEAGTVISQNSLDVYNYFNPGAQMTETNSGVVPECNLLGNQAINDLLSSTYGESATFQ